MQLAVLSDIHAHSSAFRKAVEYLKDRKDLKYCVLGDTINYGPDPAGCLQILWDLDQCGVLLKNENDIPAVLGGNHEEAWLWCEAHFKQQLDAIQDMPEEKQIIELIKLANGEVSSKYKHPSGSVMKEFAIQALLLTIMLLRKDTNQSLVAWYRALILQNGVGPLIINSDETGDWKLILAHVSLEYPRTEEYIYPCHPDPGVASRYLKRYLLGNQKDEEHKTILLHGHTHIPLCQHVDSEKPASFDYNAILRLHASLNLINPGSIGQPRDGDYRPSLAVLNFDEGVLTTEFIRLDLDKKTRIQHLRDMEEKEFPSKLRAIARGEGFVTPFPRTDCEKSLILRAGRYKITSEDLYGGEVDE